MSRALSLLIGLLKFCVLCIHVDRVDVSNVDDDDAVGQRFFLLFVFFFPFSGPEKGIEGKVCVMNPSAI